VDLFLLVAFSVTSLALAAAGFVFVFWRPARPLRRGVFIAVGAVTLLNAAAGLALALGASRAQARHDRLTDLMMAMLAARCPGADWVYEGGERVGVNCPLDGTAAGRGGASGTLTVAPP
jgi:hypothetical protein